MIGLCIILFNANLENGFDGRDCFVFFGESNSGLPAANPDALSKLWPAKTAPQKDDASYALLFE